MVRTLALALIVLAAAAVAAASEPSLIEDFNFALEEGWLGAEGGVGYTTQFLVGRGTNIWAHELSQAFAIRAGRGHFSYTIPIYNDGGAGLGDATIDYRFLVAGAAAPRISLILPTRSARFGQRTTGLQINVPVSAKLGSRVVSHTNVGATWFRTRGERELNLGQRFVFAMSDALELSVDAAYTRSGGPAHLFVVRPGVRWSIEVPSAGVTISPGVAYAMAEHSRGVLLSVSFER